MDESATWHNYNAAVNRKIEALYSAGAGGSIDVEICGRRYEIDVDGMQQVNKETKVARKIQRCDAASSSSAATLPSSTAAASVPTASSSTESASTSSSSSSSSSRRGKSNAKTKKG